LTLVTRLARLAQLLEGAALFYSGWYRLLAAECAGYGRRGEAPELPRDSGRASRLHVSG